MILILAALLAMNDVTDNDITVSPAYDRTKPAPFGEAPPPAPPSPCQAALWDDGHSPDLLAWQAATDSNRLDDIRAFVRLYPKSVCAAEARQIVTERRQAQAAFAAERVAGPLAAMVRGDHAFGITSDDYPAQAQRNGEEGTVRVAYEIAPDGRMESCHVTTSSGSAQLDAVTCQISTRRARFSPARDAHGKPIRSFGSRAMRWQIPRD